MIKEEQTYLQNFYKE
jgi:hypothetical protein